jgi:ketosteroid isomerase-like protein
MPTARDLVEELLRRSLTGSASQIDLYADDAVHDLPFSPSGDPMTLTRDEMAAVLAASAAAPARFIEQRLERLTVHEAADGVAIAEYEVRGRLASTGAPLTMAGIMLVIEAGGRIVRSRNYLNPNVLAAVMAG